MIGDHGLPGALGMKGEKGLPGAPGVRVSFHVVICEYLLLRPLNKLNKFDTCRVGMVSPDLPVHLVVRVIEVMTDWMVYLVGQDKKGNPVMTDLWEFQDCEDHLVHRV